MKVLSIIIPVLNEQESIAIRLSALQQLRSHGCEIILVDGGSVDDTVTLAQLLVDQVLYSPKGRALQMNEGATAASANILLFLHADTELPEGADKLVIQAVAESAHVWGWFMVKFRKQSLLFSMISRCMNWRASLTHICTGDQALFITRNLFESIGGFPEIPLMEDIAISKILRRRARPKLIRLPVLTSTRRWDKHGVIETVLFMWWLRLLYFLGSNPGQLAKLYYPREVAIPSVGASLSNSLGSISSRNSNYAFPNSRILVFAKDPVPGKVKTRLEPAIGVKGSLRLHRAMIARVCNLLGSSCLAPWQLWVTENTSHEFFLNHCKKKDIYQQQKGDIGHKMADAAVQTLTNSVSTSLLMIGSDCPCIDESYLKAALEQLADGIDVVLGPAEDGGYVLIGLNASNNRLFSDIDWGTDRVLVQTLSRTRELGLSSVCMDALWDVDRPADLDRLEELDPPLLWNVE